MIIGSASGLIVGVALRLLLGFWGAPSTKVLMTSATKTSASTNTTPRMISAEIRKTAPMPSAAARTAVEDGAVKFIIRSPSNSNESSVAKILLDLGSIALCRSGDGIRVWSNGQWQKVRALKQLSGYAVGRAWELQNCAALGDAAKRLPKGATTYLVMPVAQELRLVGAVERALPVSLTNETRIVIRVERTPGGHVRWILQRAIGRDGTEISPNTIFSI